MIQNIMMVPATMLASPSLRFHEGSGGDQGAATDDGHQDDAGEVVAGEVGVPDPGCVLGNPVRHQRESPDNSGEAEQQELPSEHW
jgi:hypothetical protein